MGILLKQILRLFFHNFKLSKKQSDLVLENLALRQQLSIYHHTLKRLKIRTQDRIFWVLFSKIWKEWRDALIVDKPETVILWHKKGFKLFWKFKSRKRGPGRPPFESKTRKLIEDMAKANPLWGAPRIHGELLKLRRDCLEKIFVDICSFWCCPTMPNSTDHIFSFSK